jgi:cytidylate kinase
MSSAASAALAAQAGFKPYMSDRRPRIVAVDGPAGSGKSSICHRVAERIGWTYVNTGAIYRAVGILALDSGLNLDDEGALASLVDEVAPDIRWEPSTKRLLHNRRDLTDRLLSEEAGYAASKIAKQPLVRERLLPLQRQITLAAPVGALVDGRDIGTVVFPDADVKVFLTASLEERSRRRLTQLGTTGANDAELLEDVKRGLARRDERDKGRDVAPLKRADDAVELDTSSLSLDQTVDALIAILREKGVVV